MKRKATKIDLYPRARLFIDLGYYLYDIQDKHRFSKMNGLIEVFFSSSDPIKIKEAIKNLLPDNFEWRPYSEESFEIAKQLYLGPQTKTQQNNSIRFLRASVKLYYKLDEILNRVDVIGIAFLLRSSEYDIYLDEMVKDLGILELSSVKKIKQYIIDNIVEGNCSSLDQLGYWGKPVNIQYIQTIQLDFDDDNAEEDHDDANGWGNRPPRRRGPARVRLEERIDWGAEQIHKLLTAYISKFGSFY